jgi:anti-anti-sigma factor
MQIESNRAGNVLVLAPTGRLDSTTSPALDRAVAAAFDGGDATFVIDMAGVDYISSLGLGVLLKSAKRAKAESGRIELCGLRAPVLHVFQISGFDRILGIHDTRPQAVAALATAGGSGFGSKGDAAC